MRFGETTVRVAGPGDGERIASAWLDAGAYYAALDPDYTMTPSVAELAELWDAAVSTDDPASLALVAERDDRVIAWLLARYMPAENDEPGHGSAPRPGGYSWWTCWCGSSKPEAGRRVLTRGPRGLAKACLRLWAAPRPRVAPPTERRPPPLITTFVAALRPVALGRQAPGRSRRGSNGPLTKVPLRDLRFPLCSAELSPVPASRAP